MKNEGEKIFFRASRGMLSVIYTPPCTLPSERAIAVPGQLQYPAYATGCLYICECAFLLPLQSCCLLLQPELGNTHAKLFFCTINFDFVAYPVPFCWEAEILPQLVKRYTRSHPIPPDHEDTQMGNFRVYSRLNFNEFRSNCSFCL